MTTLYPIPSQTTKQTVKTACASASQRSTVNIFSSVNARTPKQAKALATTITAGLSLLDDGYTILPVSRTMYIATTPAGDAYRMTICGDIFGCSCDACKFLGVCKHLVCLTFNRDAIDAGQSGKAVA
jgi:hypothetical protein